MTCVDCKYCHCSKCQPAYWCELTGENISSWDNACKNFEKDGDDGD